MNAEIRFIDLFSGIGGFRLGLEKAGGFGCVWSCDNNKYANQVYIKQFGEKGHYSGDIRGVDPGDIPDFELLCAGFPCQSFSVAGKRKGFQDTRGTLFFEICRIAEAKKPSLLLLENVRGLLSSGRGQVFYKIIQSLEDLGYWVEWQVLNSKYFGVPQNRQRVFIVGHLGGKGGREIFPIGEADEMAQGKNEGKREQISLAIDRNYWKGPDKHGQRTVIGIRTRQTSGNDKGMNMIKVGNIAESGHDSLWGRVYDPEGISMNINAEGGGLGAKTGLYTVPVRTRARGDQGVAISFTNPHNPEEERKVNLSHTSRAVKPPYGNQQPLILADRTRSYAGLGRNLESPKEITNALSGVQKDNLLLEDMRIRRLTPVECERLQGFPDGWTEYGYVKDAVLDYEPVYGWKEKYNEETDEWEEYWTIIGKNPIDPITNTVRISDTQRYKCLGNAVTVNVVEFLGKRINTHVFVR